MAVSMTPQAMGQMATTSAPREPFVWGSGGRRMTPEEIERERQIAASLMQIDASPVGHWTQGLARVAQNFVGGMREKRADEASAKNATDNNLMMAQLLGSPSASPGGEVPASGGNPSVEAILASPYADDNVRGLAKMQWSAAHRAPPQPHYWETNDGSLGMIGADGKPVIAYKDPTDKISWVSADNGDGTKTLVPMGPNGPLSMEGGGPSSAGTGGVDPLSPPVPTAPVGKLTPISGGPTPGASGGFPR